MKTKQELLASLDAFTRAYIGCALWSSLDNTDDSGGEPLDANYCAESLARKTLAEMIADCAAFQAECVALLGEVALSDEQAGHDFWLTRNRHGAGFWDRGLGELGEELSRRAKVYGTVNLYVHRKRIYA